MIIESIVVVAHEPIHSGTVVLGRLINHTSCAKHENVAVSWRKAPDGFKHPFLLAKKKIKVDFQLFGVAHANR